MPQFNALFGVSFMMCLNLTLLAVILDVSGINLIRADTPKEIILPIAFAILITNYFWLVYKKKYEEIVNSFRNEPKTSRIYNFWLLWLYVFLSFALIALVAVVFG